MREALRVLEQEGQVTYLPRRGYFVTELRIADLEEIYALRRVLEERRGARGAAGARRRRPGAHRRRGGATAAPAATPATSPRELAANRRFHFAILDAPDHPHTMRMIRLLWDSTEAYRALYYNSPDERGGRTRRTSASSPRWRAATPTGSSPSSTRTATARSTVLRDVLAGYQSV